MNKYIKYAIITISIFIIMTLIFCFVDGSFNIMEWEKEGRFYLVTFSLLIAGFIIAYDVIENS